MQQTWTPWAQYPDLTDDRIGIVGRTLAKVRDDCAAAHRPLAGETALSLGVAAWECSKFAICELSRHHPWLRIANGGAPGASHFIFQIGIYAVRFYHGQPDEPPARYRLLTPQETFASQGALDLGQIPDGHALRFAVQTAAPLHKTTGVFLVEFHEETQEIVHTFQIPLAPSTVTPFVVTKQGVQLPPPTVQLRRELTTRTSQQG